MLILARTASNENRLRSVSFEENQLHGVSKGEVAFDQNSQPPLWVEPGSLMASEKWRLSAQGSPSPRDPRRSAIHTRSSQSTCGRTVVLGQRQRSTAWAGALASPQKADQNTSHTRRLWCAIVGHWPSRGQMGDPTAGEDERGNEDHRICISHERMQASKSGDQSCRWPR